MSVMLVAAAAQKRATKPLIALLLRLLPSAVFALVFASHALYIRHLAATPIAGWANEGIAGGALWGFEPYFAAQDYFLSLSYALGAAFAAWAGSRFLRARRVAYATGTAGSITLISSLLASGCFLIGCCGSPMLAVYVAIFGAKAMGVGKPLMAGITALSTGCGYWCLSRPARCGIDDCCGD